MSFNYKKHVACGAIVILLFFVTCVLNTKRKELSNIESFFDYLSTSSSAKRDQIAAHLKEIKDIASVIESTLCIYHAEIYDNEKRFLLFANYVMGHKIYSRRLLLLLVDTYFDDYEPGRREVMARVIIAILPQHEIGFFSNLAFLCYSNKTVKQFRELVISAIGRQLREKPRDDLITNALHNLIRGSKHDDMIFNELDNCDEIKLDFEKLFQVE